MAGLILFPAISILGQGKAIRSDTIMRVNALKEVEVLGYGADRNLKAPEMGLISLSNTKITNLPVLYRLCPRRTDSLSWNIGVPDESR